MDTRELELREGEGPVENINPKDPPPEPMPGLYSTKMSVTTSVVVERDDGGDAAGLEDFSK